MMETPTDSDQEIRATILRCWSAVLELSDEEVTDSSNFFFDGGDSLLAVELVSAASNALGVEVPLDSILLDGSFGALVKATSEAVSVSRDVA
jgi:acyl carrier protein